MDALSDVLRLVRPSGAVYLNGDFTTPWCLFGQAGLNHHFDSLSPKRRSGVLAVRLSLPGYPNYSFFEAVRRCIYTPQTGRDGWRACAIASSGLRYRFPIGSKSLAALAEQVGYDSEPAFNRAFKREFGMPPAPARCGYTSILCMIFVI